MTLVELMVAMLIGTFLIGGAITVYLQSQANYRTADSVARLQENIRFALDMLEADLRLAGYWGYAGQVTDSAAAAGIVISCSGASTAQATDLAFGELGTPVEARDDNYDLACSGTAPRNNSDVLLIRHASARTAVPAVGQVQIISNPSGGRLFDNGVEPSLEVPVETRDVVINAYYVGTSGFDPNLPALRRLSLVDGGTQGQLQDEEVIPGIENLQVQFGLDTNNDRAADRYVDGDHPLAAPGSDAQVVAVRLWVLVRSETNESGTGFTDTAVYQPLDANLAPIQPGITPDTPAEFRRLAASKTVFLRNTPDNQDL